MHISTLLNLLVLANAAQATPFYRGNKDGPVRHRPNYEHNEEYDRRPVGGLRPPPTAAVGNPLMGGPTSGPAQIITVRPTVTVNPVSTSQATTTTSQATTIADSPVTNSPGQGTTTGTTTVTTTGTPPPATGTQAADPAYSSVALQRHNIHRSNHSAPDATWNADLASYAKTIADGCKFEHDVTPGGGGYGQNLALEGSSDPNFAAADNKIYLARAITNQWYNHEMREFLPSYYGEATPDMSNFGAWGHFSQVVWKASSQVGCATSFCPAGTVAAFASWYTVCDYLGAGNVGGGYGDNIGQPLGRAVVTAP